MAETAAEKLAMYRSKSHKSRQTYNERNETRSGIRATRFR